MNKKELVVRVSEVLGVSQVAATKAIDAVFQGIEDSLLKQEDCQFLGFGTFKVKKRVARTGRNPRTGEKIDIKESSTVTFSVSKNIKEALKTSNKAPSKK